MIAFGETGTFCCPVTLMNDFDFLICFSFHHNVTETRSFSRKNQKSVSLVSIAHKWAGLCRTVSSINPLHRLKFEAHWGLRPQCQVSLNLPPSFR